MKRGYQRPAIQSEKSFESNALACAKNTNPPPGSWHFSSPYDTFTGHMGPGFGGSQSISGSAGIGYGPGGTSQSYHYSGMCAQWVLYSNS